MSGSSKFVRGGGRGLNRLVPPPLGRGMVPLRRGPAPGKEKGRSDESSMKGRGTAMKGNSMGGGSVGGSFQGEDFQLVSCRENGERPLYAMAIRLTPGLLETLKRVEELGESTTMKFGVNNSGHIIKVAEEEFRFSSAPEPGHLCDIFEEQRRGEDGNGLLVEAGAVWRKLSVIRTLSATDKATVKARSVEAERQQKSRKAIILDHSNSLINNIAATAGDANGRRAPVTMKPKKEPPQKKRKIVGGPVIPPLFAVKTRLMPTMAEKPSVPVVTSKLGKKPSVSSPPEEPISSWPLSQGAVVLPLKPKSAPTEEVGGPASAKNTSVTQKDKVSSPALAASGENATVPKITGVVNMSELRNCLITLLMDNLKGMTIKAVEKALGEAMPNVRPDKKQIEKVIKAIASYHAPGKYMLKEGVEKGAFAKPSPGSGSSPETAAVDSPPLGDLPVLMENARDTQQEIAGTAGSKEDRSVVLHQDLKRTDGLNRNSNLPLRGGESAVSRAIRRAGEMVRGNAERLHQSGLHNSSIIVESSVLTLQGQSLKESTAEQEMADGDHISIGGDESPVAGSPEHENEGKLNEVEMESMDQDVQNLASTQVLEVDNKKEHTDGSDSSSSSSDSSDSGSDSDSESASGSRSGSGSDTDSDGSSSSASEENMDEDVDIISDDEDKARVDVVMTEASKQKLKSKDARTSLERQESRVQKQASRGKKQKLKGSGAGMNPHESEDTGFGDGGGAAEIIKFLDQEGSQNGPKCYDSEEEVDVVSSDEDTLSPPEQRIAFPAKPGEHNDNAIDPELIPRSDFMAEIKPGQDNLHGARQSRSGSESDHSIEEYETRAETSGVRGARVKAVGDQKEDSIERKSEGVEISRSKGSSRAKVEDIPPSLQREGRMEVLGSAQLMNGSEIADGLMASKEHLASGGVLGNAQRSLLGTPPIARGGLDQVGQQTYREPPVRQKAMALRRKEPNKNVETREIDEKGLVAHRGPQRLNRSTESSGRYTKNSDISLKPSGDGEILMKTSDGMSKQGEEPGLIGKGPEPKDTSTADCTLKSSRDGDTLERQDVHRRQSREAAPLVKHVGVNRNRDSTLFNKPGRDPKQLKKPVQKNEALKRPEHLERIGTGSGAGEKLMKDTEIQRKPGRDGEFRQKSPKTLESIEVHNARLKDFQKSDVDHSEAAKTNAARMNSDLELGELRDIVAGEELRGKDSGGHEVSKLREMSDLSSRQLQNKVHVSPEKEKPRNIGRTGGDVRKPPPADLKKQQSAKELPKVEVPISLRDAMRPTLSAQRVGPVHEDRLEMGNNRAVDALKTTSPFGDHNEKHIEGESGKRLAEDVGNHDLEKPLKRPMFEQSQVATALGRGDPDTTHKPEKAISVLDSTGKASLDTAKGILLDGGNQLLASGSKPVGDNGRISGLKGKGQESHDREMADKRGSLLHIKQKPTTGLLGPGSKKDAQVNGKKSKPLDVQSREFFAPYEKKAAELKGPILHYDQYLEYCKEYSEKYPVYIRLNTVLESDKEDFEKFSRDITVAKAADDKTKLGHIYGKVRKDYLQCQKRFKRMQKTFFILHDELKVIKQRCKDYAEKLPQDGGSHKHKSKG